MRVFHPTKVIRRAVTIKSSDRALPNSVWVLTISATGVNIHKLGHKSKSYRLSWRSIIGHALIHRGN